MSRRRKPRNRGGRPSKFTTETAVKLAVSLARGARVERAARDAGVGVATAYRWLALSRAGDPRYAALADAACRPRRRRRSVFGGSLWESVFQEGFPT